MKYLLIALVVMLSSCGAIENDDKETTEPKLTETPLVSTGWTGAQKDFYLTICTLAVLSYKTKSANNIFECYCLRDKMSQYDWSHFLDNSAKLVDEYKASEDFKTCTEIKKAEFNELMARMNQ